MRSITLSQLKSDIAQKMKGTSIREISDFYATAANAGERMLARIDPETTRRTVVMTTPFFDQINDYALVSDYKRMIDIRPQVNRQTQPGLSHYSQTTVRQFRERLDADSFSIGWNNMTRVLRSQRLPAGNVAALDSFDSATANGSWAGGGDISTLTTEILNYVEGNGALKMNISGATGTGYIENSTASVVDLSALNYQDFSFLFVYIPSGKSSLFTSFALRRGESVSAFKSVSVTTKADGTAFTDGWNMLMFDWSTATTTGSPTNLSNTYRRFTVNLTAGTAVTGFLIDNWTNSLGELYEIEYYSEYLFRTIGGSWIGLPTLDTDLVNVDGAAYQILLSEMMIDVTQQVRTGAVRASELMDWRLMLNGQPQSRYVKDPPYHGAYADYNRQFPSSAILTVTKTYDFDV